MEVRLFWRRSYQRSNISRRQRLTSPFCDLTHPLTLVPDYMWMEFGISKCAIQIMKRVKAILNERIVLSGDKKIQSLKSEVNESILGP